MINLSQEEILAIYLSLKIAFVASLASLPLAIALGYLFARREFWLKKFFIEELYNFGELKLGRRQSYIILTS